jgi:hypothetical protein
MMVNAMDINRDRAMRRYYRINNGRHPSDWCLAAAAALIVFALLMGWLD